MCGKNKVQYNQTTRDFEPRPDRLSTPATEPQTSVTAFNDLTVAESKVLTAILAFAMARATRFGGPSMSGIAFANLLDVWEKYPEELESLAGRGSQAVDQAGV